MKVQKLTMPGSDPTPIDFSQRFDAQAFRRALAQFATGVTIATTLASGDPTLPVGVTINSFTSVSLDPPLVLFCLGHHAGTHDAFRDCAGFVINMLDQSQKSLSDRFAKPAVWPWRTQWQDIEPGAMTYGPGGLPVFAQSLAWLVCKRTDVYPAGDHTIILGEVERLACAGEDQTHGPLLYYGSRYRTLA